MAKKKDEAQPEEAPKAEPKNDTGTADIAGKTIDERMADLLKDHKRMGAR
jgi:hypothetical protein